MRLRTRILFGIVLLGLGACGGGGTVLIAPGAAKIVFTQQPANGDFQNSIVCQIEFQDADGNVEPVNVPVGINVVPHPNAPLLTGALLVNAVDGVATFDNLFIDATGTFELIAKGGHSTPLEVTSVPFTYQGPPTKLAFLDPVPDGNNFVPLTPFRVQIQDKNANPVALSGVPISLIFNNNTSRLLFHASGAAAAPRGTLYAIDPQLPSFFITRQFVDQQPTEIRGLTFDQITDICYGTDATDLYGINPVTGAVQVIGTHDPGLLGFFAAGLTIDAIGALHGDKVSNFVFDVDLTTGVSTAAGPVTIGAETIVKWQCMDTHPATGEIWAIVQTDVGGPNIRRLIQFSGATLSGSIEAILPAPYDGMAGMAFFPNGRLFLIQGDGSGGLPITSPRQVWELDTGTLAITPAYSLFGGTFGTPENGEKMVSIPGIIVGTSTVNTVGGVATFSNVGLEAPGLNMRFQANAPDLAPAVSNNFDIDP